MNMFTPWNLFYFILILLNERGNCALVTARLLLSPVTDSRFLSLFVSSLNSASSRSASWKKDVSFFGIFRRAPDTSRNHGTIALTYHTHTHTQPVITGTHHRPHAETTHYHCAASRSPSTLLMFTTETLLVQKQAHWSSVGVIPTVIIRSTYIISPDRSLAATLIWHSNGPDNDRLV